MSLAPYLVNNEPGSAGLEVKVFFIWGSTCACCLIFTYFCIPETKGLSLEQVDQMLSETSPRTSSSWKPHQTWAAAEGHVHTKDATVEEKESV